MTPHDAEMQPADAATPSRPFILTMTTPPGMPWDQHRLARLEAAHASPLPTDQVVIDLRRLTGWRPGAQGRFAAACFRRQDISGERSHIEMIEGQSVTFVAMDDAAQSSNRWRRLGPVIGGVVAAGLLAGSIALALSDKTRSDEALEAQRQVSHRQLAAAERAERSRAETKALNRVGAKGTRLYDALEDLVWLSRARDPAASISKIEWTRDGVFVEVAGPMSPVATQDRKVAQAPGGDAGGRWRIARTPPPEQRK